MSQESNLDIHVESASIEVDAGNNKPTSVVVTARFMFPDYVPAIDINRLAEAMKKAMYVQSVTSDFSN